MNLSTGTLTSRSLPWRRSTPANSRLWLLFYLSPERAEIFQASAGAPRYVFCERVLDRWKVLLESWAPSAEDCPVNPLYVWSLTGISTLVMA